MNSKPPKNKTKPANYIPYFLIASASLAAIWGVALLINIYTEGQAGSFAHIPFWMMLGSLGILLNYLPIAKSKTMVIPLAGIAMTAGTAIWFCINNFVGTLGFGMFVDRIQLGLILLASCYCLTHLSLLTLTYRKGRDNILLIITGISVLLSGLIYILTFSGSLQDRLLIIGIYGAGILFFIKMALTITLVVTHLSASRNKIQDTESTVQ